MSREILDAAVVQQFKKYLTKQNKVFEQLTKNELKEESQNFLQQYYPGAKSPPNKMIELMSSPEPSKSLDNSVLVNPEEEKTCSVSRRKRSTLAEFQHIVCPDSTWHRNLYGDCIKYVPEDKDFGQADTKCKQLDSNSQVLILREGVRRIRMWKDIADSKFSGFDMSIHFWLKARSNKDANQYKWVDDNKPGDTTDVFYLGDFFDSTEINGIQNASAQYDCLSVQAKQAEENNYKTYITNCGGVRKFFCTILNPDYPNSGIVASSDPATPSLPEFPCTESSRKRRQIAMREIDSDDKVKDYNSTVIRKKRSALTCPSQDWYQNILGDCIKVYPITTRADAASQCNSVFLDGSPAKLLRLDHPDRAKVIYIDLADKFPGYDINKDFWIAAIKSGGSAEKIPPDGMVWESDLTPVNNSGVFDFAPAKYFNILKCVSGKASEDTFRFRVMHGKCTAEKFFFCIFENPNPPSVTFSVSSINSSPTLPEFPCYDLKRKRRNTNDNTNNNAANGNDNAANGNGNAANDNDNAVNGNDNAANGNNDAANGNDNAANGSGNGNANGNDNQQLSRSIEKLNLLLDPSKEKERESKKNASKEDYKDRFGNMDLIQTYSSLFEILWYSQMPCFDVKNVTSDAADQMSIIKRCSWKGKNVPCPAIFKTLPTDRGMCCSFNMEKAEELFEKSNYADMVQTMQDQDMGNR